MVNLGDKTRIVILSLGEARGVKAILSEINFIPFPFRYPTPFTVLCIFFPALDNAMRAIPCQAIVP